MVRTIELDEKVYVVCGLRDMMELIDEHMGTEFREALEEMLEEENDGREL